MYKHKLSLWICNCGRWEQLCSHPNSLCSLFHYSPLVPFLRLPKTHFQHFLYNPTCTTTTQLSVNQADVKGKYKAFQIKWGMWSKSVSILCCHFLLCVRTQSHSRQCHLVVLVKIILWKIQERSLFQITTSVPSTSYFYRLSCHLLKLYLTKKIGARLLTKQQVIFYMKKKFHYPVFKES